MNISFWIKIGALVSTLGIAVTARYIFHKPQKIIEETAEGLIEEMTGVEIDFDGSKERQEEKKKREDTINTIIDLDDVD